MQIESGTSAYPETGTLQEIGARVGDVVEYGMSMDYYTVEYGKKLMSHQTNISSYYIPWDTCDNFRMISRAPESKPSPVREVTTRVVPNECIIGHVEVTKHGKVWMRHVTTAAELTAAIATLTEIRDAMVQE